MFESPCKYQWRYPERTESFLRNADHADDPNKNQLRHINAFFSLSYFDAKEGFINNESFLSSLGSLQGEEEE